jgi:hypothetical protein
MTPFEDIVPEQIDSVFKNMGAVQYELPLSLAGE